MSEQSQKLVKQLEARIEKLTGALEQRAQALQQCTQQQEISAEINRAARTADDVDGLSRRVTRTIKNYFKLYHVGLYLIDHSNQQAVYTAGAGKASRKLKQINFQLPLDQNSTVAWVSQKEKPCLATAAGVISPPKNASTLSGIDPLLLSKSRAELALPLLAGKKLVGVLDTQSQQEDLFSPQRIEALQSLTDQIASLLERVQLQIQLAESQVPIRLDDIQSSLQETNLILQVSRKLSRALNLTDVYSALVEGIMATDAERCVLYSCDDLDVNNVPKISQIVFVEDTDPAAEKEVNESFSIQAYPLFYNIARGQETAVITNVETDSRLSKEEQAFVQSAGTKSLVIVPLIARSYVTGLVSIEFRSPRRFSEREIAIYRTLCNQATIAIENARQVEQTATALAGTQSLYRAGRVLASTDNLQQTLEEALVEFLYSLNLTQGGVTLLTPDKQFGQLMAYVEGYELQDTANLRFPINVEENPYQQILLSGQPFVSVDAPSDPRLKHFQSFNVEQAPKSLLQAPLILKGETIGWIGADAVKEYRDFSQSEIDLARAMADQVSIAIQNNRLLEQTKRRAEQSKAVAEVGQAVSGLIDLDEVLNNTVNLIRTRFGFYHVSIFLLDQNKKWAVVRASTGEVGRIMVERPHRLEVGGQSIVGFATARAQPRIALDVGQDAVHFENPLLPDTRSEMALPLISRGTVIGALDVQSVEPNAFNDEDVATLQVMANQLAAAIENARLFEQTQRRLKEQAILYEIGTKIGATLELQEATDELVIETAQALNAARCALVMLEEESLHILSDYASPSSAFPNNRGERYELHSSTVFPQIIASRKPFSTDIEHLPSEITGPEIDHLTRNNGTALAIVPVTIRNQVIAFLAVYDDLPGRRFTQEDISLLASIALQAANAIENARLFESARESQTFMKSVLDEIPDAIFIKDREHKWVVVNRAFAEELLGRSPEELIGQTDYAYFPKEEADYFWEQDNKTFETGQIQETEETNTTGNKTRTVYTRKIPLQLNGKDGKPDYLIGIAQDITERKQRELERERLIQQTQRSLARTQSLYRISDALTTTGDQRPTFETVLGEYLRLLNLEKGSIMLIDRAGERSTVEVLYADGHPVEPTRDFTIEEDLITQYLLEHPEPVAINDLSAHPLTKDNQALRSAETEAILFIPLIIQGKTAGLIAADSSEKGYAFAESDIALGEAIADQLSIWLENRQLLAETQYRTNLLQTAAQVSGAASSILDTDQLIETSVNLIRDHFDFYYVGLFLVDEAREWAILRAGTGEAGRIQIEKNHRLKIGGESMIGWSVQNRQARIALDVGEEKVHFQNPYLPETHSEMALPLTSRDEAIGALTVQSVERGAFSDEDVTVLQTMADQLANAIVNARLFESSQKAAQREAIIREISGKIRGSVSVDEIMQTTVTELSKVLGSSRGGITLNIDKSNNR